jgi:hypothetical protein
VDAWFRYPQYRKWFNKLYVADLFGYKCGPAGIPVTEAGYYVVRPIYNLAGMSVGAKLVYLEAKDIDKVPPSYFWVEEFHGIQYSLDYVKEDGKFKQLNCYVGVRDYENLSLFKSWTKSNHIYTLPDCIESIDVPRLNIEMIGDKIVEVHLRNGFDHMMQYQEIYPVFEGIKHSCLNIHEFEYIKGVADGYGHLKNTRLG